MRVFDSASERLRAIRQQAVVVRDEAAIFRLEGPGAVTCLQGLLTNDVEAPGDGAFLYGALLTPKGMIVVDFWVMRWAGGTLLAADRAGREPAAGLFRRLIPPRLARVTDLSDDAGALWVLGPGADSAVTQLAGTDLAPGRSLLTGPPGAEVWIGRGTPAAPFRWLLMAGRDRIAALSRELVVNGALPGTAEDLGAARVLAGFPALGAEIGERTLPQEVRYDELGGISYTKGCYVGQETVARLHFRGHANWLLQGLRLPPGPRPTTDSLMSRGKAVGRVTTLVDLGAEGRIGLGTIRRETGPGERLDLDGTPVDVVTLPFPPI